MNISTRLHSSTETRSVMDASTVRVGEETSFKTLKSKFQNDETLKIRTKPTIPEKPQTPVTSPTTKISNPLIASMNSAKESRVAPRVIFKDEKSSVKRQLSQPETFQVNMKHPHVQPDLLDKNQKKEGDLIKQALKDRKFPLVLPVAPANQDILRPQSTPVSASPIKTSSPKQSTFNFKMPLQSEKEKTNTSLNAVSTSAAVDGLFSSSPSVKTSVSNPPEVQVPPVVAAAVPLSSTKAPDIPPSSISPPAGFESENPTLKGKMPPLVLPISPAIEKTPKPQPTPSSSVSSLPVNVSTPKKTTLNVKSPFHSKKEENTSESDVPLSPALDTHVYNSPTPSAATIVSKNVSSCVLPVLVEPVPPTSIPANSIPAPVILSSAVPESDSPLLRVSETDIFSKTGPTLEISNPIASITQNPTVPTTPNPTDPVPDPVVFPLALAEEEANAFPEMMSDILNINIPPPIIPEDLPDAVMSVPHIPASGSPRSVVVSTSPVLSHTGSPAPATYASITPEPSATLVPPAVSPDTDDVFVPSLCPLLSPPASFMEPLLENEMAQSHKALNSSSSPKSISALSALARAEEMAPSRYNSCDQRLLSLLEKSKRKYTAKNQSPTTPELGTLMETAPSVSVPLEFLPPEQAEAERAHHETPPPEEASPVHEALVLPHIPVVGNENLAWKTAELEPDHQPSNPPLSSGLDLRPTSPVPNALAKHSTTEVKAKPPPPPPRRHLPPVPNLDLTPDKPALAAPPVENNEIIIPAPDDFISRDSVPGDSKFKDSPDMVNLEVPQEEVPEILHGTSAPSVHDKVFWDMLGPKSQSSEEVVPNVEAAEFGAPRTETDGPPHSEPDFPRSETIPSPGTEELNYKSDNHIHEDQAAVVKQAKTKKQHKGSPMNPYAEAPILGDGTHKKNSRKNSEPDDKELKKREKQSEKKKEKDKVKEKKEQKEKEREKKEQKEREKTKEHKEREKKEQKEKEREKKEQKEKEKRENEMKKRFKVTGEEEVIYHAKVMEDSKGRKNDLAVKAGEIVNIIRTTDCPKGKWLAKDSSNRYGYISVDNAELDMQEMLEMGKKAKASSHTNINGLTYTEPTSTGSRSPSHYIMSQESFTDDSEDWGEEDTVFTAADNTDLPLNRRAVSPERVSPGIYSIQAHTEDTGTVQARHEALHKLATFFSQPKTPVRNSTITEELVPEEPVSLSKQDVDLQILPPPDLYADHVGPAHI